MIRRAIILAAGSSTRLRPLTNNIPKALLKVNKFTIFDMAVLTLSKFNINDIVIIAGHAKERLEEYVRNTYDKINFTIVENDKPSLGNIYSFYIAKDYMDTNFILLNSDVIFHVQILASLLEHKGSAVAIDDHKRLGEEEMKVKVNNNNIIKDISKNILIEEADGEYIGLMKFDSKDAMKVLNVIKSLFDESKYNLYYEDAIRLVANKEDCFYKSSTKGLPCMEIDTIEDLEKAKKIINIIENANINY